MKRLAIIAILFLVLAAFMVLGVFGCKHSPDPAPPKKPTAVLIVDVSGLGGTATVSQLDDIVAMETADFPGATIGYMGKENGWMADVPAYCNAATYDRLILLGHSFGADTVAQAATKLPAVDLLILLDPVCNRAGVDTITIPASTKRCIVFVRDNPQFEWLGIERRARVMGKHESRLIHGTHNSLPHDPAVMAEIYDAIKAEIQ